MCRTTFGARTYVRLKRFHKSPALLPTVGYSKRPDITEKQYILHIYVRETSKAPCILPPAAAKRKTKRHFVNTNKHHIETTDSTDFTEGRKKDEGRGEVKSQK